MKQVIMILLMVVASGLISCKEKSIGVAYVVGDRVPVFAKTDRFLQPLKTLPRDTKIEILEARVPDPRAPKRAFWYRVRSADIEGFISYDEELIRKNMASFKPVEKVQSGLVTASSLRLRQDPTLSSKVIIAMPRLTVVDIVQEGSLRQKIGGKEDTWVKVRAPGGKEGFSFSGFLHKGNPDEIRRLAQAEFEMIEGFVFAKVDEPAYRNEPGGRPITEDDPVTGGQHELSFYPMGKKGAHSRYGRVTARMKHKKTFWYHVENTHCDPMLCYGLNAWVSEKEVEYVKDFFQHSLSRATGERNIPLLREVQASLGENEVLHAGKTEYEEISLITAKKADEKVSAAASEAAPAAVGGQGGSDDSTPPTGEPVAAQSGTPAVTTIAAAATTAAVAVPTRHFLVKASIGTEGLVRNIVIAQTGTSFRTLGSFQHPNLRDIDGDGRAELISDESERADTTYSVYTYLGTGKGFRKVLNFSVDSGVQFADPYIIFHEIDPKYFQPAPPFDQKKFAKATRRVLLLEQGNYREIPFADVPEEVREKI